MGRKLIAAALAASVVLSSSGPGAVAFAQATRISGAKAPVGGSASILRLPAPSAQLSPSTALSLTPAIAGQVPVSVPVLVPMPTARPAVMPAVAAAVKRWAAERTAKTRMPGAVEPGLPVQVDGVVAKSHADSEFRRLTGEADANVSAAEPVVAAAPAQVATPAPSVAPQAPAAPAAAPVPAAEKAKIKYIHEEGNVGPGFLRRFFGWLGYRTVHGVVHEPGLGSLPSDADSSRIIDQISGEFGIPRKEVLELGAKFRLREASPRKEWLFLYDWLKSHNVAMAKRYDSHKYEGPLDEDETPRVYPEGWRGLTTRFSEVLDFFMPSALIKRLGDYFNGEKANYRELANRDYAPGWRGQLERMVELQKHLVGAFVRFPYHLFDMFIFGYFRQAIAFEFFHDNEDFFALSKKEGLAKKWLEAGMREQYSKGSGYLGDLRTKTWFRQTERWLVRPMLAPLFVFITRRISLAIMSAVAMGMLGAFAPTLPLSFALTAIPILGPTLVAALNTLPVLVASVPFIGNFLAPVVSAAVLAFLQDLVLGPLLNTWILSTLMTFPAAVRERLARAKDQHPLSPLSAHEIVWSIIDAGLSWSFWRANLKTFFGMAVIGAEIKGVMTYASQIDAAIDPGFEAVLGRKVGMFHAIGGAVELPEGESPIPFGGAITWGNVLVYKFQEFIGFNLSDAIMRGTLVMKSMVARESAVDSSIAANSAQALVAASGERKDKGLPFDADLWQRPMNEVMARIKELAGMAGGLDAEMALAKEHGDKILAELGDRTAQLARLEKLSNPVTPEEIAEHDSLLAQLTAKSDEVGVRSKLAQMRDLMNPPSDKEALARLEALQKQYEGLLPPPPPDRGAYWDDLAARDASMKALADTLKTYVEGKEAPMPLGPVSTLDKPTSDEISALIAEIKNLRAEVKGEVTQRDAAASMLAVINKVRNRALAERNPTVMKPFLRDMSKLSVVVEMTLALRELDAGVAGVQNLIDMNAAKRARIAASVALNKQNQAIADQRVADIAGWRADVDKDIASDNSTINDIVEAHKKTGMAEDRIGSFQKDSLALINLINARDRGGSSDALTEYNRRLDVVKQMAEWRTNGGTPNDPNALSMKKLNDYLVEVNDGLKKAQDGLVEIKKSPNEFAGVLIALVPGPDHPVTDPTPEQIKQLLQDRRIHWQNRRADFVDSLDSVLHRLGRPDTKGNLPGNSLDEFGDSHSKSLPARLAKAQKDNDASQAEARKLLGQLDGFARNINQTALSANIPTNLSSMPLKQLQDEIKTYGDKLKAVKFKDDDSLATTIAQMDLIAEAKLVPYAADAIIRWSEADGTITAINEPLTTVLPNALKGLQDLKRMFDVIVADVSLDEAYINNMPPGGKAGAAQRQALIDRKTALLRDAILPSLQSGRAMLGDVNTPGTLFNYQQKSINDVSGPDNDFFKLYDAKKTLITEATKVRATTVARSLATFGAEEGNLAEAMANIDKWRNRIARNITGYVDAQGRHHKGVDEYVVEIKNREDPNFDGTELLYGELQPFSLPKKIAQYGEEFRKRVAEINTQNAQINKILGDIETMSKGGRNYDLSRYRLPVGVTADAAGVARIEAIKDARIIPDLGDKLLAIGDENASGSTSISIGGEENTVPTGVQKPIGPGSIPTNQTLRLLALETAKRLVPASNSLPDPNRRFSEMESAPAAYAVARFLYSDAVVQAAEDGLRVRPGRPDSGQVPKAKAFISRISKVLNDTLADIPNDEAYARNGGDADAVYNRKVKVYHDLNVVLQEGLEFFNVKQGWNRAKFGTLDRVQSYYDALHDIHVGGLKANAKETTAVDTIESSLLKTKNDLIEKRAKVTSFLKQLNPREKSALSNVSEDLSKIMEKTRAVLEANINWHDLKDQLARSRTILQSKLSQVDDKQVRLAELLADPRVQGQLAPSVVRDIESLRLSRGGWGTGGAESASLVIRKSNLSAFIDTTLEMVTQGTKAATQDLAAIKADLLKNPMGLQSLIPNSQILDFGDTADGYYMVYQSNLGVPHGLETGSWVTLGNIGRVFGSNVSLSGYQFVSPPSKDGENAPYGGKGVDIQVDSLGGRNWVNYINADLHRFALDIPKTGSIASGLEQNRLMIMDDFAVMLMGDRLYVGLAGFADGALNDTANKPFFYGGNAKTSVKLTEVMRLDAEQRELFVKDPRKFVQDVDLNFTGYDADYQKIRIEASGKNMNYSRTQLGPHFDLNRLMNPDGGGDSFTLDMYYAKTSGTEDINQQSAGITILKGFSIKNNQGHTWMQIDNRFNAEKGVKMNEIGDRLSVSLPDYGLVVSAEGRVIGGAGSYLASVSKKFGDRTTAMLSYGSPYVGLNNRLTLSMNTSFSVEDLWRRTADNAKENLRGGKALDQFNGHLDEFYKGKDGSRTVAELQRVFEGDVARKLITQDIGLLSREIETLRKAGAVLGNTRVRGMVGFVTRPVSEDLHERAVGGGPVAGTYSEMSLSKTQKALIEAKAETLFRESLRLQDRLLALTKDWQAAVVEIAEAQWALKMALFEAKNAPSPVSGGSARVRVADAEARLHQAVLRFNTLTGRDLQSPAPFNDIDSEDLQQMLANVGRLIAKPDRLTTMLKSLDENELQAVVGEDPFNLLDWLPWVERLSAGIGVQFQDMMATQALTLGASLRLPIYDPASKERDGAYVLESRAAREEIAQAHDERTHSGAAAAEQAKIWEASAHAAQPRLAEAADRLSGVISQYRNGLIGPEKLRQAFDGWNDAMSATVSAFSRAALLKAQASMDAPFTRPTPKGRAPLRLTSIDDAFQAASANSHNLAEIAERQKAAEQMARAVDHRIQKAWLDLNSGAGMTAGGVGWLPSLGVTGIPVTPVFGFEFKSEEMRELSVREHAQQSEYYKALKLSVEAGLAVQLYQNMVALRAAQSPMDLAKARQSINFLLGRPADAEITVDFDEGAALASLARLLAAKDPVGSQRRILQARVSTAKAVEEVIDKDQRIEMLQLEPMSMVVRALGRVMGALSDSPSYNPEHAAAARFQTLTEERQRDTYEGRRAADAARLRLQLNAANDALRALSGSAGAESASERARLTATAFSLKAGLMALDENPEAARESSAAPSDMPKSWADLVRRLAKSEQSRTAIAPEKNLDLIPSDVLKNRAAAFGRYYYANQSLGHHGIYEHHGEGWIELRLTDPSVSSEALLKLAKLSMDKSDRIYRDAMVGAASRADIAAAQFEGDARMLNWLDRAIRERSAAQAPAELDSVRMSLMKRLTEGRHLMVARLGLPTTTELSALLALVNEDAVAAESPRDLAARLISEIRARQVDSIRRTLFADGTPASWGNEDGLMGQIKADTIAERMSYKGFTPVAAFGLFRGRGIGAAFLEAPDPREIENGLERVMSDVLRKELKSSGRLQELTARLHSLMLRVEDGAKSLEARRRLIESAETSLRARAETSGKGTMEYLAAQSALTGAWDDFAKTMTATKADFITLVTELEALGEGETGGLKPLAMPDRPEPRASREATKTKLLDYWTNRLADASFESAQDELLARMGTAVTAEQRARVRQAAAVYRAASLDADSVRSAPFTAAERLDRLTHIDLEGRRLVLRSELAGVLRGVGLLTDENPLGAQFLEFMRADIDAASKAFNLDRRDKVSLDRELSRTYWSAHAPTPAQAAAFARLDDLNAKLEDARDELMTSYLKDERGEVKRFVVNDLMLDAYLNAQKNFDAEIATILENSPEPNVVRALQGLYDLRAVLERSVARARHGHGMAALDALIMLEDSRLRAARWTRQVPSRIDPIAESLGQLKETRERWAAGKTDLEPLYAVTLLDAQGRRTWEVKKWITAADVARMKVDGENNPGSPGAIIKRGTGLFVDKALDPKDPGRYEVIGGADAADAARDAARRGYRDNRAQADLQAKMKDFDFVALGALGKEARGWKFADVFGPEGLYGQGRVHFFESGPDGKALLPAKAMARSPDKYVMMVQLGGTALSRGHFPTLKSIENSAQAADFAALTISPKGAASLIENARRLETVERRRGWIEVKLNSFGFARDEQGQVAQLYNTAEEFSKQEKAFDDARVDLESATRAERAAEVEKTELTKAAAALKVKDDGLNADYLAAQSRLREALRRAMLDAGLKDDGPAFKLELDKRTAQPNFSRLPKVDDVVLSREIADLHEAYQKIFKSRSESAKAYAEASDKLKLAEANHINALKAVENANLTLARSTTWSLHRTEDLVLGLDSNDRVVKVDAPGVYGPQKTKNLSDAVGDGGPVMHTVSALKAAVVDADGRLRRAYAGQAEVDAAFTRWVQRSYQVGADVKSSDDTEAMPKVRFSHYEETLGEGAQARNLPVLLGASYLRERAEGAQSALSKAKNWAVSPLNLINIPLELVRGITSIPAELAGRDPRQHNYLGRVYMYKTEGGSVEHQGVLRSVAGAVDVLNLLPDKVERFFDPSQLPSVVRTDSAVRPGTGLWDKSLRADIKNVDSDVMLGAQFMAREATYASQDFASANRRTLARFQGGVEELTLETRRGRAGFYQESNLRGEFGADKVAKRLEDAVIASDPASDGLGPDGRPGDVVTSATPDSLFVERAERRVRILPGASAYARQAAAFDGYAAGVAKSGTEVEAKRAGLEAAQAAAEGASREALGVEMAARGELADLSARYGRLAQRIGTQIELERRIDELKEEIATLRARIAFVDRYLRLLDEARRNPGGNPIDPRTPSSNPVGWAWIIILAMFAGAMAALGLSVWLRRRDTLSAV